MNNTALRAGAQSTDNAHMVFANREHEKFYFEKLGQAEDHLRRAGEMLRWHASPI